MTRIYIKTIQDREILFGTLEDVDLYNRIKCDKHHISMDEALDQYSSFAIGDALVSSNYS